MVEKRSTGNRKINLKSGSEEAQEPTDEIDLAPTDDSETKQKQEDEKKEEEQEESKTPSIAPF